MNKTAERRPHTATTSCEWSTRQPRVRSAAAALLVGCVVAAPDRSFGDGDVGRAETDRAVGYLVVPAPLAPLQWMPWQTEILEKVNRRDRQHFTGAKRFAIPLAWPLDERAYSQMPLTYAAAAPIRKMLIVHQPGQMFGGYERGQLVRWGPISSGRERLPTPQGLFHLNWRSPGRHSTVDPDWYMRWYFNFS